MVAAGEVGVGEEVDGFGTHPDVFQGEAGLAADAGGAAGGDGERAAGGGEDGLVVEVAYLGIPPPQRVSARSRRDQGRCR